MIQEPVRARDLMSRDVKVAHPDDAVEDILDTLMSRHIHGAPVVDGDGVLVGIVTQQDILFGSMTKSGGNVAGGSRSGPATGKGLIVGDIMTSPAVSATEEAEITRLCEMMFKLKIQRVPIVNDGRVTGMLTALDICGAVSRGDL